MTDTERDTEVTRVNNVHRVETLQKLLQILALVAAGAWTIWIYRAYERDNQSLTNEKMRLEIEQTKAFAKTEREGRELAVRQQDVALKQQRLTLDQQQLAASVQQQQQSYALEEQRLSILSRRQALTVGEIDRESRGIQLGALRQIPLEQHYRLSVERVRGEPNTYEVSLRIDVTNRSQIELNIFAAEFAAFLGDMREPVQGQAVQEVNLPSYPGPVVWRQYLQRGYVSIERDANGANIGNQIVGGFAYGRLSTGETMSKTLSYYVHSDTPNRWFGYTIAFRTEQQGREPWRYLYDGSIRLSESDRPPAQSRAELRAGETPIEQRP